MHLTNYWFTGDADQLVEAHGRMLAANSEIDFGLHVLIRRPDGILVIDACPTREDFEAFQVSDRFASLLADAGLPFPRIEPLGDVEHLLVGEAAKLPA